MQSQGDKNDLIDHVYAIAIEPERFRELVDVWEKHLNGIGEQFNYSFPDDLDLVNRHLDRASTILSLVEASDGYLPQPLIEKLNSEPQAMIAFASDGTIEAANAAAEKLYGISEGANISELPLHRDGLTTMRSMAKDLFRTSQLNHDRPPDLCRIELAQSDVPLLVTFHIWETAGNRRFVLMKCTDFVWPDHLSPLVQSAFDMTDAEINVMKLLVEGNSLEHVAALRGSSMSTVRTQVRSIYSKTATRNQSEFLRMAIGLTMLELSEKNALTGAFLRPPEASEHCFPLPDHRRILSLTDGRQLDYAVFGPDDGIPCLHFHNEFYGDIWPTKLAELALREGLRVIAPARAYYARTSPYPAGVVSYEQTSADIDCLLEELGIKRVLAVSQVWGLRFALHFAATRPGVVAAMVSAAPSLPLITFDHRQKMPKFARFIANIVRHQSHMLKFVAKAGVAFHNRVGSKKFLETVLSQSAPDLEVIKNPNNLAAIVQGFKFVSSHGHKAYFYDYRDMLQHDRQMLIDLKCRTHVIIGTEDNNSRVERAKSLIQEGANLDIVPAENGGDMLFYSHPQLVVDTIARAWNGADGA